MKASDRRPRSWVVQALVVSALLKGVALAFFIPPFQTPDEYGHYDYVLYLSKVPVGRFLERLSRGRNRLSVRVR